MDHLRSVDSREPRLPLFVPVTTRPALSQCWTVNVSRSGIGLMAAGAGLSVREGELLDVEMQLPGRGTSVRARGLVMWSYSRPGAGGAEIALGLRFAQVPPQARLELDRYLLEHRFHLAVAFAGSSERALMREALGDSMTLNFESGEEALRDLLRRGDISALLVCGESKRARTLVERLHAEWTASDTLPADMLPQVIFCADDVPEALVALFNAGHIQRALRLPLEPEALRIAVQRVCSARGERTEQRRVAQALERALMRHTSRPSITPQSPSAGLVTHSRAMQDVLRRVQKVARHKVSVLLQGETGTGKELLAGMVHEHSPRAGAPLVIQDCGVLTETLLESELFGHVRGAFTGAVTDKPGLFVMADGGTVFLDEIENTSPDLQAKLLRVIEAGMVRPVGGTKAQHVDVRVVAASNRDLALEVEAGRFRRDLFYRLNTIVVRLPPLRERPDDILPLAEHFLALTNVKLGLEVRGFSPAAQAVLLNYTWPGNVRELRNVVEAAALMLEGSDEIGLGDLPEALQQPEAPSGEGALRQQVRGYERELIRRALEASGGVVRRAARQLRTSPVTLRRKALEYGLL